MFSTDYQLTDNRITPLGMSHKTACGWSQVCIDSGPVRPGGPVPFAVTRSHTPISRSLLLIHVFGCRLLFCFPLTLQCIALDGSRLSSIHGRTKSIFFSLSCHFHLASIFPVLYIISFCILSCITHASVEHCYYIRHLKLNADIHVQKPLRLFHLRHQYSCCSAKSS